MDRLPLIPPLGKGLGLKAEDLPIFVHSHGKLNQAAQPGCVKSPISQRSGQAPQLPDEIGLNQKFVTPVGSTLGGPLLFPGSHESWEIQIILMRWRIRTVVETEFAVIAFLFNLREIL